MRPHTWLFLTTGLFATLLLGAFMLLEADAQPGGSKRETATQFADRLFEFDKNKDGKLTKDEVTDTRLHALFERADANNDGTVTREELESLFTRESLPDKGGFGPGDKKGPKGKGKGPPFPPQS